MASDASLADAQRGGGAVAYVLPFAVFIAFLAIQPYAPVPQWARFAVELALIAGVSRSALTGAPCRALASFAVGALVFLIWVAPDSLLPAYRHSILFNNAAMGHVAPVVSEAQKHDAAFLFFRVLMSVAVIPVLEELFWRGFLMRWLIARNFRSVPIGAFQMEAFLLVAVAFALEHGSYWDVGLAAGLIYNGWAVKTRNLWDCILAHAVTNGLLAAWVIAGGNWQFWS